MTNDFSVLLPCRNEDETIESCIREIFDVLAPFGITPDIVVASSSDDRSDDIASLLGARVVAVHRKGYGRAIKEGLKHINARYVVMGDADGSYDFSVIPALLAALESECDVVIANRFKGGVQRGAMPLSHRFGNWLFTFLGSILMMKNVGDIHSGLRAFRREAVESLNIRSDDMRYDTEMVARAITAGMHIGEIPSTLRNDGRHKHGSYLRTWTDGWLCLRVLASVALARLFHLPA